MRKLLRRFAPVVRVGLVVVPMTVLGLASASAPATALSGTPAFATYTAPSSLPNADNAGEPSIGVNPATGAVMYQAYSSTYKVQFNDATTPATATWANVTPAQSQINIDPILATDRATGRTWAGGLAGACSLLNSTDNDGGSWTPDGNTCAGSFDHETVGSGPYAGGQPLTATYSRALYYCAQTSVDSCVTSTNGGLSFGPPTPVNGACSGLHGHVKVAPDGTAYLPNSHCTGHTGGGITRDNGTTWNSYAINQSDEPARGFDPSVATTPDNTVYEAWMRGSDYHPMVGKSADHGATWTGVVDLANTVSPPITASTFQAAVAGDNGRVAVAFLGSQTGTGVPFDNGYHGVWNLFVSYTYDGGATWTTVKASTDPVQRGCIWDQGGSNACRNLLDFMDANVTKDGRVVVGYADGCINACAGTSGTEAQSTDAYATIARQSTGKGLFAAYDTAGGNIAPTACFSHTESALTTSADGSCSTDSDGTISSWSWSWGDGSAASTGATASHTYAAAGTYNVTLTVTDNGGATSSTTQAVTVSSTGGGGTDPDPSTPNLTNGAPTTATSGASGTWQYFKIQVPAGKTSLNVQLKATQSCGLLSCNPDLDLYVRNGAKPTTSTYDASPQTGTSNESVSISNPAAAYWYVGVYVYSGSQSLSYSVTATYS